MTVVVGQVYRFDERGLDRTHVFDTPRSRDADYQRTSRSASSSAASVGSLSLR